MERVGLLTQRKVERIEEEGLGRNSKEGGACFFNLFFVFFVKEWV